VIALVIIPRPLAAQLLHGVGNPTSSEKIALSLNAPCLDKNLSLNGARAFPPGKDVAYHRHRHAESAVPAADMARDSRQGPRVSEQQFDDFSW